MMQAVSADASDRRAYPALEPGTVRIDYHVHTRWSFDGHGTLEALVERANEAGIDRLCITDHDTIDGALALQRMAPRDLEIIVGCEFTTEDGSQIIGLNLTDMIIEKNLLELMNRIRAQGGQVLIPHPFRRHGGVFRPETRRSESFVGSVLAFANMVECFNGRDSHDNNRRSYLFAMKRSLPAVAGSDAHTAGEVGSVFVEYRRDDELNVTSARRIYFPDRPERSEFTLKRRALEFYHRHEARMPAVVAVAYRTARERSGRDRAPRGDLEPRAQYELPATAANVDEE